MLRAKRRINWDCGICQRKPFDEFILDQFAWSPLGERTLQELIDFIRKEYDCSYERAHNKLMLWLKQHNEEFEYTWRGHNRMRIIKPR